MSNVGLIKDIGLITGIQIVDCLSRFAYPVEADGASTHTGAGKDEIQIHLTGTPDETAAAAILVAIDKPICVHTLLDITVDAGTYLVADLTSITADPVDMKYIRVIVAKDDTKGVLEVFALEKTDLLDLYPDVPVGKTECAILKEYELVPAGTELTESKDLIR